MSETNRSVGLAGRWREEAGSDNPAGPLFTAGAYAPADIVSAAEISTIRPPPCSACSGSNGHPCC
jgi:hypothetical protein